MNTSKWNESAKAHFGLRISDFGLRLTPPGEARRFDGAVRKSAIRNPQSAIRRSGFTLIELLLVLMILAFLATIVVPKLAGTGDKARIKTTVAQIGMFETALERFRLENGRYPTSDEGLRALVEQPANCPNWDKEGYLGKDDLPDDPWGNKYQYRYPGQHNQKGFDLWSFGPDGQDGGEDDIGNWSQQAAAQN